MNKRPSRTCGAWSLRSSALGPTTRCNATVGADRPRQRDTRGTVNRGLGCGVGSRSSTGARGLATASGLDSAAPARAARWARSVGERPGRTAGLARSGVTRGDDVSGTVRAGNVGLLVETAGGSVGPGGNAGGPRSTGGPAGGDDPGVGSTAGVVSCEVVAGRDGLGNSGRTAGCDTVERASGCDS
jgi:hypothetical protein